VIKISIWVAVLLNARLSYRTHSITSIKLKVFAQKKQL